LPQPEKQKELEAKARVETTSIHEGKIFTFRREKLHLKGEPPHEWDIIQTRGAVALIPITTKGNLLLIRQWRRAVNQIIYELPAGNLEKGEEPMSCAQRELQEETGFKAENLTPFGGLFSTPGFCTEYVHLFIATGLKPSPLPPDLHEGIEIAEIPLQEALLMIDSGKIIDGKTVAGLLRYQREHSDA
jgi:ADP-ribose pyrophosphatase